MDDAGGIGNPEAVEIFAELLDFVRPRHRMVLLTTRADGGTQASPVTGGSTASISSGTGAR